MSGRRACRGMGAIRRQGLLFAPAAAPNGARPAGARLIPLYLFPPDLFSTAGAPSFRPAEDRPAGFPADSGIAPPGIFSSSGGLAGRLHAGRPAGDSGRKARPVCESRAGARLAPGDVGAVRGPCRQAKRPVSGGRPSVRKGPRCRGKEAPRRPPPPPPPAPGQKTAPETPPNLVFSSE